MFVKDPVSFKSWLGGRPEESDDRELYLKIMEASVEMLFDIRDTLDTLMDRLEEQDKSVEFLCGIDRVQLMRMWGDARDAIPAYRRMLTSEQGAVR